MTKKKVVKKIAAKKSNLVAMPKEGGEVTGTLDQIQHLIDAKIQESQQSNKVAAENIQRLTGYAPGQPVDCYAVVKIVKKVFGL